MKILVYKVGQKNPEVQEIDGSLESMQKVVGGYIEVVRHAGPNHRVVAIANEEGLVSGLPFNRVWNGTPLVGDFFLARSQGSKFVSLTPADLKLFSSPA